MIRGLWSQQEIDEARVNATLCVYPFDLVQICNVSTYSRLDLDDVLTVQDIDDILGK